MEEVEGIRAASRPSMCVKPSRHFRRYAHLGKVEPEGRRANVDELARRYEMGLDLWSGEELKDEDAEDWLLVACDESEAGCVLTPEEEAQLAELYHRLQWANL